MHLAPPSFVPTSYAHDAEKLRVRNYRSWCRICRVSIVAKNESLEFDTGRVVIMGIIIKLVEVLSLLERECGKLGSCVEVPSENRRTSSCNCTLRPKVPNFKISQSSATDSVSEVELCNRF